VIDPRDLDTNGLLREILCELQSIRVLLEEHTSVRILPQPPVSPIVPQFPDPPGFTEKPRCSKCGMQLDGVMGYVCGDIHCPTFPKVTC
jgi:hypothetical protein